MQWFWSLDETTRAALIGPVGALKAAQDAEKSGT
jgi:hypothetical protein